MLMLLSFRYVRSSSVFIVTLVFRVSGNSPAMLILVCADAPDIQACAVNRTTFARDNPHGRGAPISSVSHSEPDPL